MTHNELIELALSSDLCSILSEEYDHRPMPLRPASAFNFLVLEYKRCNCVPEVKEKIKQNLISITTGGKEPSFNLGLNWHYPMIVNSIALVKETDIWEELTEDTKNRLTCLMECFAYLLHYAHDRRNYYKTGLGRNTHFDKKWAPNIVASILGYANTLCHYFGGEEKMTQLYTSFDYDAFMTKLITFGFTNAAKTFGASAIETEYGFTIPSAKEILEGAARDQYCVENERGNINIVYGGFGEGIKRQFLCKSLPGPQITIGDTVLMERLVAYVYAREAQSRIEFEYGLAKIADNTISPEEGRVGMFFELNQNWRSGRSCAHHAMIDFAIMTSCLSAMKMLGIFDINDTVEAKEKVRVGNDDLIYKLQHGYAEYNDGQRGTITESNYAGYYFWKDIWQNEIKTK